MSPVLTLVWQSLLCRGSGEDERCERGIPLSSAGPVESEQDAAAWGKMEGEGGRERGRRWGWRGREKEGRVRVSKKWKKRKEGGERREREGRRMVLTTKMYTGSGVATLRIIGKSKSLTS